MTGKGENIIVNFYHLGVLWSSVAESCWGGAESLIPIFIPAVTQGNEDAGVSPRFLLVVLLWIKRIRRQIESKIPFCNPSGGKILLKASASYISY